MKLEEVEYENLSPMMKQYYDIKKNYKDVLLFYRLGDFYELFFDDAILVSRELGLTLTGKNAGLTERVPMCGAPHHSIKTYVQEAISKGYKVAICEQMEDPKLAKGMVKREVTEVISKGTMIDLEFLDNKDFNYFGSILVYPSSYIVTYLDLSTGELNSTIVEKNLQNLLNVILTNGFKEIIINDDKDTKLLNLLNKHYSIDTSFYDEYLNEDIPFLEEVIDEKIKKGVRHILHYLKIKELKDISLFSKINLLNDSDYLLMDTHTVRNLELFETLRLKERQNSLIWLIDKCKTSMGSRKLKNWMLKPLKDQKLIEERLNKIDVLNSEFLLRSELVKDLYEIYDIERLCGKVASSSANARDLIQLNNSLKVLPDIKRILKELKFDYEIEDFKDLSKVISDAINLDAPLTIKEGNLINDGYNAELDELREIRGSGKNFISAIEKDLKEETGINNLKVGYNKVFGYFIEVTKGNAAKIKEEFGWERKQTLVNAERFISPILKEKESQILNAEEKIMNLEYDLFIEIRTMVKNNIHKLIEMAQKISEIDALVSLSVASEELNLVRPSFNSNNDINIVKGRHPVVEYVSDKEYVPNDIIMDSNTNILLITGPNMSGKSTYMRELAIIVILSQMGSFVPCEKASLPIFDQIFTRIGASDDLVSGESTFMVEMKEANNAITNATKNSLILFDELGRGTATYDGMSLARSILEYIDTSIKCKTLFSTHYHELTVLPKNFKDIKNVHVSAKEENGTVIFMHKVIDGAVDKSYGINVAELSGMPKEVLERAKEILDEYEKNNAREHKEQLSFNFNSTPIESKVEKYLKTIDENDITAKEALDIIYVIKEMMK